VVDRAGTQVDRQDVMQLHARGDGHLEGTARVDRGIDVEEAVAAEAPRLVRLDRVGDLFELTLTNLVAGSHFLTILVSWTYWNSEFTVVGLAVLFVYIRRHEAFTRFRNTILFANVIGLIGYVFMPTAPPRLLGLGFVDQHRDGLVSLAANPYAAMPSLHAADALIVGVVLFSVCRSPWAKAFWAVWPAWVWFAVMATGNHFWLDCVAGIGVALVAMAIVYNDRTRFLFAARRA
jgi:hypothetical protein